MVDPKDVSEADTTKEATSPAASNPSILSETPESAQKLNANVPQVVKPSHSSKKAKAKNKKKATAPKASQPTPEPDKGLIESREEMHERLKNGTEYNSTKVKGVMIGGTLENPVISKKTVTFPENQIQKSLQKYMISSTCYSVDFCWDTRHYSGCPPRRQRRNLPRRP
jgi:hypothetical protein